MGISKEDEQTVERTIAIAHEMELFAGLTLSTQQKFRLLLQLLALESQERVLHSDFARVAAPSPPLDANKPAQG